MQGISGILGAAAAPASINADSVDFLCGSEVVV
jgi:hypothetical protein